MEHIKSTRLFSMIYGSDMVCSLHIQRTHLEHTSSTLHAMRAQGVDGNRGLAPRILNLCNTRSGQLHAPNALLLGKSHLYIMNRRLGGPLSRCARVGKGKNLLTQSKSELESRLLGSPAHRLVTISRLPTKTTQFYSFGFTF